MKTAIMALMTLAAVPAAAQQAAPVADTAATTRPVAAPRPGPQPALPGLERPRPVQQQQASVGRGAPVNGVLVLYGNERCPTNADGDEIVICERRSQEEQFRVPKELRNFEVTPQNQSWAARAQDTMNTGSGVNTIGSCSPVGPGGATGCFAQSVRANRAANRARNAEANNVP